MSDGRPVGVEALARFPDQATRTPDKWFAEAARIGLGTELEMLAVRQAIRGLPFIPVELYVALNVSPATALSPELEKIVAAAPAGRLVVEVTEHSKVADQEALHARRSSGCAAMPRSRSTMSAPAIPGLRRILDLRPDILKLDMSLTRDVDSDPARAALARALVTFADGIGCRIVAEGIETEAEMRALRSLGVGYGQGWHFSRPMPSVAVQQFLLGAGKAAQAAAPPRRRAGPPHRLTSLGARGRRGLYARHVGKALERHCAPPVAADHGRQRARRRRRARHRPDHDQHADRRRQGDDRPDPPLRGGGRRTSSASPAPTRSRPRR